MLEIVYLKTYSRKCLDNVEMLCDNGMRIGHLLRELSTAQEIGKIDQLIAAAQHVQMGIAK